MRENVLSAIVEMKYLKNVDRALKICYLLIQWLKEKENIWD